MTYVHEERFWSKVDASGDCWMWTAASAGKGYGKYSVSSNGKTWYPLAHRHSYEILVGSIPDGMVLDHLCRNRKCVNPDHLEAVTQKQNVQRGMSGGMKTHCAEAHEFVGDNTSHTKDGWRICLDCRRAWDRKRRPLKNGRR
jgi:hypothetical protein